LYNESNQEINLIATPKTAFMQTHSFNNYQKQPQNDLFLFLKCLIKNSFLIAKIPMTDLTPELILSHSTSPYLKKINGYKHQGKDEPIIIYI
jgi:hypothetical protein